jgi:hypothetical protein
MAAYHGLRLRRGRCSTELVLTGDQALIVLQGD